MLALSSTGRKLTAILNAAVSANELQITAHYEDRRATGAAAGIGAQLNNSNGTTQVTICTAPTAGISRAVNSLTIYNKDTTTSTITIKVDDSGTGYTIFKAALDVGDQAYYEAKGGWRVLTSAGALK